MTTIEFPNVEKPALSIVIVVHGGIAFLRPALEALLARTEPCYQVVLVDNASDDGTGEFLRHDVLGATLIFNDKNTGFASGVNQGAAHSRGPYLCFLNSDALVQHGWLQPLVETLESSQSVGAVVPLLLNSDGSVQEAGSVIDSEGWALAIGGGDNPARLAYRFRRDVDFGSAACLLTRSATFGELGGFDPAYDPAYYEDVDYAFKLREVGLRTVYQPRSTVVHLRFGSGTASSATALVRRNRDVFVKRWQTRLRHRPWLVDFYGNPGRILRARDAETPERMLVICGRIPGPDDRLAQLVLQLAQIWPHARVTLAALASTDADEHASPLLDSGVEVVADEPDWHAWFYRRRFHYSLVVTSEPRVAEQLEETLQETQPQAERAITWRATGLEHPKGTRSAIAVIATGDSVPDRHALMCALAELGIAPPTHNLH